METDKIIIIKNCTKRELKRVLRDWCALYESKSRAETVFDIAEISADAFIVKVDKRIDDGLFLFLVNYCAYPIGLHKVFEAEGYATIRTLQGKQAYVFNNKLDPEGDNVWIITQDNETHRFDFRGEYQKKEVKNEYKPLRIDQPPTKHERFVVEKRMTKADEEEKSNRRLEKRFRIFSTALLVGIPLAFLLNSYFSLFNGQGFIFACSAIILLWFTGDYKIFNDAKKIYLCVAISLICIVLGIIVYNNYVPVCENSLLAIAAAPLVSVPLMWLANRSVMNWAWVKRDVDFQSRLFPFLVMIASGVLAWHVFVPIMRWLGIV